MGATVAADLQRAGKDVIFVAHGPHLSALHDGGMSYACPDGEHRISLATAASPDDLRLKADDILPLATKPQDEEPMSAQPDLTSTASLSEAHRTVLRALIDQLFPRVEQAGDASSHGLPGYVLGQLEGRFGQGLDFYSYGPYERPEETGFGWQSAQTPAQIAITGLEAIDMWTREMVGRSFAGCREEEQRELITRLESDDLSGFGDASPRAFFELVMALIHEGLSLYYSRGTEAAGELGSR